MAPINAFSQRMSLSANSVQKIHHCLSNSKDRSRSLFSELNKLILPYYFSYFCPIAGQSQMVTALAYACRIFDQVISKIITDIVGIS